MSAARNRAKEWRRAVARRNYLANQIASAWASGLKPKDETVHQWINAAALVGALSEKRKQTTNPQTQT